MDSRKALIATWILAMILDWIFWLVSFFVIAEYSSLCTESGCSGSTIWIVVISLYTFGFILDPVIFYFSSDSAKIPIVFIQTGFVCFSAILLTIDICTFAFKKNGIWFMIVSKLIKFILQLLIIKADYALRPTQVPQLSQPRPNLLANQPPTALTPNFEDVEQPPPSYEEYLAQRNDMPPKYEDLEEAPPAYQETMV